MVGDFNKRPSFDPETQRLELKSEYVGTGDIVRSAGQVLVIFNTEKAEKVMYPYYFANGLDDIFDIVPI
jgi:hypothetical protein